MLEYPPPRRYKSTGNTDFETFFMNAPEPFLEYINNDSRTVIHREPVLRAPLR